MIRLTLKTLHEQVKDHGISCGDCESRKRITTVMWLPREEGYEIPTYEQVKSGSVFQREDANVKKEYLKHAELILRHGVPEIELFNISNDDIVYCATQRMSFSHVHSDKSESIICLENGSKIMYLRFDNREEMQDWLKVCKSMLEFSNNRVSRSMSVPLTKQRKLMRDARQNQSSVTTQFKTEAVDVRPRKDSPRNSSSMESDQEYVDMSSIENAGPIRLNTKKLRPQTNIYDYAYGEKPDLPPRPLHLMDAQRPSPKKPSRFKLLTEKPKITYNSPKINPKFPNTLSNEERSVVATVVESPEKQLPFKTENSDTTEYRTGSLEETRLFTPRAPKENKQQPAWALKKYKKDKNDQSSGWNSPSTQTQNTSVDSSPTDIPKMHDFSDGKPAVAIATNEQVCPEQEESEAHPEEQTPHPKVRSKPLRLMGSPVFKNKGKESAMAVRKSKAIQYLSKRFETPDFKGLAKKHVVGNCNKFRKYVLHHTGDGRTNPKGQPVAGSTFYLTQEDLDESKTQLPKPCSDHKLNSSPKQNKVKTFQESTSPDETKLTSGVKDKKGINSSVNKLLKFFEGKRKPSQDVNLQQTETSPSPQRFQNEENENDKIACTANTGISSTENSKQDDKPLLLNFMDKMSLSTPQMDNDTVPRPTVKELLQNFESQGRAPKAQRIHKPGKVSEMKKLFEG